MDTNPPSGMPQPGSQPPVRATAVSPGPTQVVYVPQPTSFVRRMVSWLGWMGCFLCFSVILGLVGRHQEYYGTATSGVEERYHSREKSARDKVAIIEIEGVIGTVDEFVKKQIDHVREDPHVKAVVVRVNSPGGTITGSDYILHHLKELKKSRQIPLVVSMGSIAASGGYYVAMAVGDDQRTIYAEPTTTTGSIGVIIPHYDVSGLLERLDVKDDSIASHPRKQLLSMTRPISADDRQVLEAYMGDAFTRFKDVVKSGRPKFRENPAALDALATGEIFTATRAHEAGLVDELGFIEAAIDRAAEVANLKSDQFKVIHYQAPQTLLSALSSAQVAANPAAAEFQRLQQFWQLQVPQAYYLASMPSAWAAWNMAETLGGWAE